jgi:HemY protein
VSPALWILGALLAGSLAAHVLLPDNGYVLVSFRGYVIEMSVPVLAFLAITAYVAVRLLVGLWRAPRRLGAALARARARQAGLQATRGYIALAEGRLAQGERLLTRDVRRSEAPLLNYLAAARAAQMQGDRDRRDLWLRMATEQEPAATDAVLLTQAELQLEDGQYDTALASLERVRQRHPGHAQALKLLGELHFQRGDWRELAALLPQLRRRGNVPRDLLDRWSVEAYAALLAALPASAGEEADRLWEELPRELRQHPRLSGQRVRALVARGDLATAEEDLRRVIPEGFDPALVDLYGDLQVDPAQHLKRIEAWLKERPEDPALLLAAGRTCIRHQLWGKARSYLETSLAVRPSAEAWQALGQLLARVGEAPAAARAFERGLALSVAAGPAPTTGTVPAVAAPAQAPSPPALRNPA